MAEINDVFKKLVDESALLLEVGLVHESMD
jgi:hypothetical protein